MHHFQTPQIHPPCQFNGHDFSPVALQILRPRPGNRGRTRRRLAAPRVALRAPRGGQRLQRRAQRGVAAEGVAKGGVQGGTT